MATYPSTPGATALPAYLLPTLGWDIPTASEHSNLAMVFTSSPGSLPQIPVPSEGISDWPLSNDHGVAFDFFGIGQEN